MDKRITRDTALATPMPLSGQEQKGDDEEDDEDIAEGYSLADYKIVHVLMAEDLTEHIVVISPLGYKMKSLTLHLKNYYG